MATFYLYRLKAIRPSQRQLFEIDLTRREFVKNLLESRPTRENRKDYLWHIGNVKEVDEDMLLFAAGRTTKLSREKYDEQSGDFLEVDDEESPFTYVFFDLKLSVLAIAPKPKLAPTTKGIARNIEKLLNTASYNEEYGVTIEIDELKDPDNFIDQLHQAFAVVSFKMEFGEPNPFDVEKDYHKPMEELLKETGGAKGVTQVVGEDLERDPLEALARSVASVGNEASARIRHSSSDRPVTKHMGGDPAAFLVEEFGIPQAAAEISIALRDAYRSIRESLSK